MKQVELPSERTSVIPVERGLYLFRYASAQSEQNFPVAEVRHGANSEGSVEIISAPGAPFGKLSRPGTCLVIRAENAGEVVVALRRGAPSGSLEASFRMESLVPRDEADRRGPAFAEDAAPAYIAQSGAPIEREGVSLLAHLALRGDVAVNADEWVAGPDSPAPIEGLEIRMGKQAGLQIEVQVSFAGKAPRWSEWLAPGVFAGTRGRSLPLGGVRLRLRGALAETMEIAAEALFLGSLVASKRGREVELASATGLDPLVGLRLGLRQAAKAQFEKQVERTDVPSLSVVSSRDQSPRVRVFRASNASGT